MGDSDSDYERLVISEPSTDDNSQEENGPLTPLQTGQPIISAITQQPPPRESDTADVQSEVSDREMKSVCFAELSQKPPKHPGIGWRLNRGKLLGFVSDRNVWRKYPCDIQLPLVKHEVQYDDKKHLMISFTHENGSYMLRCENCNFKQAAADFHEHFIMHLITCPFQCPEKKCRSSGFADDGALLNHYYSCHPGVPPQKTISEKQMKLINQKINSIVWVSMESRKTQVRWKYKLANPQIYSVNRKTSRAWREGIKFIEVEETQVEDLRQADASREEVCTSSVRCVETSLDRTGPLEREAPPARGHEGRNPWAGSSECLASTSKEGQWKQKGENLTVNGLENVRKRFQQTLAAASDKVKPLRNRSDGADGFPPVVESFRGATAAGRQEAVSASAGSEADSSIHQAPVERVRSGDDDMDDGFQGEMEVDEEEVIHFPSCKDSQEGQRAYQVEATLEDVSCRFGFPPDCSPGWVKVSSSPEPEDLWERRPLLLIQGLPAADRVENPGLTAPATIVVPESEVPASSTLLSPLEPMSKTYRSVSEYLSGMPLTVAHLSSAVPHIVALESSSIPTSSSAPTGPSTTVPSSSSASHYQGSTRNGGSEREEGDVDGGDGHRVYSQNAPADNIALRVVHLKCQLDFPPNFTLGMISLECAKQMYQTGLQRKECMARVHISILIALNWVRCVDCCSRLVGMDHMVRHLWRHSHCGVPCRDCEDKERPSLQCVHIVNMVTEIRDKLKEDRRDGMLILNFICPDDFPDRPSPGISESVDSDLVICEEPIETVTIDDDNDDEDDVLLDNEKTVAVKQEPDTDVDFTPSQPSKAIEQQAQLPIIVAATGQQAQLSTSVAATGQQAQLSTSVAATGQQAQLSTSVVATGQQAQQSTSVAAAGQQAPAGQGFQVSTSIAVVSQPSTSHQQQAVGVEPPGWDFATAINLDPDCGTGTPSSKICVTCRLPDTNRPHYYLCNFCTFSFLTRWCLEIHLKTRHPVPLVPHYLCSICEFKCMSVELLLQHLDAHANSAVDKVIPCLNKDCVEVFISASQYISHQDEAHPERKFFRCLCNQVFSSLSMMVYHLFNKAIPVFMCTSCSAKTCNNAALKEHIDRAHQGSGSVMTKVIFTCYHRKVPCDDAAVQLALEKRKKILLGTTSLVCQKCQLVHPDEEAQRWHANCHLGKKICSDQFAHDDGKPLPNGIDLICPRCQETFRSIPSFMEHLWCHVEDIRVTVFGCPVHSEFWTTQRITFLQHIRSAELSTSHSSYSEQQLYAPKIIHSYSKVAKCSETGCGFLSLDKTALVLHRKLAHRQGQNSQVATCSTPGTSNHAMARLGQSTPVLQEAGPVIGSEGVRAEQAGAATTSIGLGQLQPPLYQTSVTVSQPRTLESETLPRILMYGTIMPAVHTSVIPSADPMAVAAVGTIPSSSLPPQEHAQGTPAPAPFVSPWVSNSGETGRLQPPASSTDPAQQLPFFPLGQGRGTALQSTVPLRMPVPVQQTPSSRAGVAATPHCFRGPLGGAVSVQDTFTRPDAFFSFRNTSRALNGAVFVTDTSRAPGGAVSVQHISRAPGGTVSVQHTSSAPGGVFVQDPSRTDCSAVSVQHTSSAPGGVFVQDPSRTDCSAVSVQNTSSAVGATISVGTGPGGSDVTQPLSSAQVGGTFIRLEGIPDKDVQSLPPNISVTHAPSLPLQPWAPSSASSLPTSTWAPNSVSSQPTSTRAPNSVSSLLTSTRAPNSVSSLPTSTRAPNSVSSQPTSTRAPNSVSSLPTSTRASNSASSLLASTWAPNRVSSLPTSTQAPNSVSSLLTSTRAPNSVSSLLTSTRAPNSVLSLLTSTRAPNSVSSLPASTWAPNSVSSLPTSTRAPNSVSSLPASTQAPNSVSSLPTSTWAPNSVSSLLTSTRAPNSVSSLLTSTRAPNSVSSLSASTRAPNSVSSLPTSTRAPNSVSSLSASTWAPNSVSSLSASTRAPNSVSSLPTSTWAPRTIVANSMQNTTIAQAAPLGALQQTLLQNSQRTGYTAPQAGTLQGHMINFSPVTLIAQYVRTCATRIPIFGPLQLLRQPQPTGAPTGASTSQQPPWSTPLHMTQGPLPVAATAGTPPAVSQGSVVPGESLEQGRTFVKPDTKRNIAALLAVRQNDPAASARLEAGECGIRGLEDSPTTASSSDACSSNIAGIYPCSYEFPSSTSPLLFPEIPMRKDLASAVSSSSCEVPGQPCAGLIIATNPSLASTSSAHTVAGSAGCTFGTDIETMVNTIVDRVTNLQALTRSDSLKAPSATNTQHGPPAVIHQTLGSLPSSLPGIASQGVVPSHPGSAPVPTCSDQIDITSAHQPEPSELLSGSRRKQQLGIRRVEDASILVVERDSSKSNSRQEEEEKLMDVDAEPELGIKVVSACSIPIQEFYRIGALNSDAGSGPHLSEEGVGPMEVSAGERGPSEGSLPPAAAAAELQLESNGCLPCVVDLCDVGDIVSPAGSVTITDSLLGTLRKRKCCSSFACLPAASGNETGEENFSFRLHLQPKRRKLIPELESDDDGEETARTMELTGEVSSEVSEEEDMDFDSLEKAALVVSKETIMLDQEPADGVEMKMESESGSLLSSRTSGMGEDSSESEWQPRKRMIVSLPFKRTDAAGKQGKKKMGPSEARKFSSDNADERETGSHEWSAANQDGGRLAKEAAGVRRQEMPSGASNSTRKERDWLADGHVVRSLAETGSGIEDAQASLERSNDANTELPKALCLICNITLMGLDVASDIMAHLRDDHHLESTYNRCPYCMAVSSQPEDVEKHVKACHLDRCVAVVTQEAQPGCGPAMAPLSVTCLGQEVPAEASVPGPSMGKGMDKRQYKDTVDKCLLCLETFEGEEDEIMPDLKKHMMEVHLDTSVVKCGHCLAMSNSPQDIAWHSKICHQSIWMVSYGLSSHDPLEQQTAEGKEDLPLVEPFLYRELNTCLLCKERFVGEDTNKMVEHMDRQHKSALVRCGHCNCMSGSTADIISHCRKHHRTVKLALHPPPVSSPLGEAEVSARDPWPSNVESVGGSNFITPAPSLEQDGKTTCWHFVCTKCGMGYMERDMFSDHMQACFHLQPYSYLCPRAACSSGRRSFTHPEDYYRHAKDQHGNTTEPSLLKNRMIVRQLDCLVRSGEMLGRELAAPNPQHLLQSISKIFGMAGPSLDAGDSVSTASLAVKQLQEESRDSTSTLTANEQGPSLVLSETETESPSDSNNVEVCRTFSIPSTRSGPSWKRSDSLKFICNECDATISSLPAFERHLAKHSNFHCFRKVCDWCGYVAEDIRSLTRHRKVVHPLELYTCDRCSYQCQNNRDMKEHYRRVHNELHWGTQGKKSINLQPKVQLVSFLTLPPHRLSNIMSANGVSAINCMDDASLLENLCDDEEMLEFLNAEGSEEENS